MAKLRLGEVIVIAGAVVIIAFSVVVGRIIYVKPPPVQHVYLETEARKLGEAVYRKQGCGACHEIFNTGTSTFGPGLDGVGSRRKSEWLARYLNKPWPNVSKKKYRLEMPPVTGVSKEEFNALVDYLSALRRLTEDGDVIEP